MPHPAATTLLHGAAQVNSLDDTHLELTVPLCERMRRELPSDAINAIAKVNHVSPVYVDPIARELASALLDVRRTTGLGTGTYDACWTVLCFPEEESESASIVPGMQTFPRRVRTYGRLFCAYVLLSALAQKGITLLLPFPDDVLRHFAIAGAALDADGSLRASLYLEWLKGAPAAGADLGGLVDLAQAVLEGARLRATAHAISERIESDPRDPQASGVSVQRLAPSSIAEPLEWSALVEREILLPSAVPASLSRLQEHLGDWRQSNG